MLERFKEFEVLNVESVKKKLVEEINKFKRKLKRTLRAENPYFENKEKLEKLKRKIKKEDFYLEILIEGVERYKELNPIEINYWQKEIKKFEKKSLKSKNPTLDKKLKKEISLSLKVLQKQWEKNLKEAYESWRQNREKELTEEFIKKTKEWLKSREEFYKAIKNLSFGSELFSLEEGELSKSDIEEVKKWVEFISNNKNIKKLVEMLGRIKRARKNRKQELVSVTKEIVVTKKKSIFKNELDGVKLGNDMANVLPQELMLLDSEEEILFYKKYIERSLSCFESIANKEVLEEEVNYKEEKELKSVEKEEKQGPIILCVDTSGSMSGEPEYIAKAITLYIATIAKKEKRDCFLINFSTSITTFELSGKKGVKDLVEFLKLSFYGGTDVAPALNYATKLMKDKYKKADLLVISDFVMNNLDSKTINNIKEARKNKNRFYSLVIGNYGRSNLEYFDKVWIFNSIYGDIEIFDEFDKTF
jgi:uncharacterized protein with von Willebrand factor type A (vWA) domain